MARKIIQKTGSAMVQVCILAPQSVFAVAGILGVLKAGKCFVPMLPRESDEYLRYLWENSEASLIVCQPDSARRAASICGDPNLVIAVSGAGARPDFSDLCESPNPNDISAIMYTSGSTGKPKGVMTTGQAILDRATQHIEMAHVTSADRQASVVPWQFAASFPDIFAPLMAGACIFLYDNHSQGIDHLAIWIRKNAITLLKLPSSLIRRFIDSASADLLTTVRYVYISGGSIKAQDARSLLAILPEGSVLMHGFGSTETNLLACMDWGKNDPMLKTLSAEDTLPAGYPVSGKRIQILDDEGRLVAPGEEGELVAVSRQLFAGYWKQTDMTAQCLKELPDSERAYHTGDLARMREDGCLEIIGRKGHRVKIRGLRIDLQAVESLLRSLPYINDAAAVEFFSPGREAQLVAYLETVEGDPVTTTRIREDLKKTAPGYMTPSRFVMMEVLPKTASGKIDRTALPPPGRERPALDNPYVPPRTPLEEHLADIWAEVLDIEKVGIHDRFLELGGDSLLVVELELRLQAQLNISTPTGRLLQTETIAQMSEIIGNPSAARAREISMSMPFPLRFKALLRRIKKHIIASAPGFAAVSPSYEFFLRLHKFWLSLTLVRFLYRRKISVFRQWLDLTDQTNDAASLVARNLMVNTWFVGREFLMAQQNVFDKWVRVTGEEHLKQAAQGGRGAILVFPHTRVFFPCIRERLVSRSFQESYFLHVNNIPRKNSVITFQVSERLKEASEVLRRGGVVWIAGDGAAGKVRKVLTKYGRQFPFRAGAADLAVKTGAPLILVFPDLKESGIIEAEFLSPLLPGLKGTPAVRAGNLLQQYAETYISRWPQMLPNMTSLWQRVRLVDTARSKMK